MRCPVTSGPHQCEKEAGHDSEHECTAGEYAIVRLPRVTLPAPPPSKPEPTAK